MPWLTAHPCRYPGCPNKVRGKRGYCTDHMSRVRRVHDEQRPSAAARGYDGDWRRRRAAFLSEHPDCANNCGDEATTVDHIIPLRDGGEDNERNWQALCKPCHDGPKQRLDRARRRQMPAVALHRG
jgi:5-methylcytosine-specific restriction protein A